jgi:putative transposase
MQLCEWFDSSTIQIQNFISTPNDFFDTKTPKKYDNVLSSLKKSDNNFNLKLFNDEFSNDDLLISSHKYQINFNEKQHKILEGYYKECKKIYDLCIDIWTDYKECTSNWQIFKDVIFQYLYRNDNVKNLPITQIKNLIINELKKKQNEFNLENEKNKELIDKLKKEIKEKYKKEMEEYEKKVKENKNKTIKDKLIKPKRDKVKIDKIKNPSKPRGINVKKPAPDESLKSEIKEFCKNLSNARNQAYEGGKYNNETKKFNDDAYEMKYKNISNSQTISVNDRNISIHGLFKNALGKLECDNWEKIINKYPLDRECKLQYDTVLNKYYIFVIFETKEINIKNRKEVVALDPGEKIFNYFYSNELEGKIGDDMRIKIIGWRRLINKYNGIIGKKKNTKGKKLKNKKALKNKIRKLYLKIKGYVNEVHKKSAKFLCENYSNILIPEFKTKPMISKHQIKTENERIKKIPNKIKAKEEIKKLNKKIKLSSEVKFVLTSQSHCKFKEYLKAIAKRYRTNVYEVDESYTSQCCTLCGFLSKEYDKNRTKSCKCCGLKIDRDTNGSRNIYIKSICSKPGMKARLASLLMPNNCVKVLNTYNIIHNNTK